MKTLPTIICPMFSTPCRHCSEEHSIHPHTTLDKDPRTGLFKPGKNGKTVKSLGFFCNDTGKFVSELHYCPVKWSLTRPSKEIEIPKQKWKTRKHGDTKRTPEVLRIGQQKLSLR